MLVSEMYSGTFEAAILDLDGTVYRGDRLLPGAERVIDELRDAGTRVLFLTNKPIQRRTHYSEKLIALGIPATPDDVINSGWVTARYLREHYPDLEAFVIGEEPLLLELHTAGIRTTTSEPGDLLVASMDRGFTYEKLDIALRMLNGDTPFVATNPDPTCPTENGEIPDAGGVIGAIEGVSGKRPDTILGKPSVTMIETVKNVLDVDPQHCLMVGDRPETDVKMGNRAGMTTVLVLSGVTDANAANETVYTPDHVIEDIGDLNEVYDSSSER